MSEVKIDYAKLLKGDNLTPQATCYRADEKFKQDVAIVPMGYTPAQIGYSDGFVQGYNFRDQELKSELSAKDAKCAELEEKLQEAEKIIAKYRDAVSGAIPRIDWQTNHVKELEQKLAEANTTKSAVDRLCKALKSDHAYWISWQANIAMAFVDCVRWAKEKGGSTDVDVVADQAAEHFLQQLTKSTELQSSGKGEIK